MHEKKLYHESKAARSWDISIRVFQATLYCLTDSDLEHKKLSLFLLPHLTERQTHCQHSINTLWYKNLRGNLWSTPGHPSLWHGSLCSDLAAVPTEMMENTWHFTQTGGKILYMRNHQLTKEVSSEENNFFSLLDRDSKIIHIFW